MIDSFEFRRVMGHFATGVTIVSTRTASGQPCGLTANAVCSVSIDPVLLLACVERSSHSHDCIHQSGVFAVNILDQESGETLSRRFSSYELDDKFAGVAFRDASTGVPVLVDALAWLECRVRESVPAGDHTIFIGDVLAGDAREGEPLLYYRGGYGRFSP